MEGGAFQIALRVVLAVVFLASGFAKVKDAKQWQTDLEGFGFPSWIAVPTRNLVPWLELLTALLLLLPPFRLGAALFVALIALFSLGMHNARSRKLYGDCGCFGPYFRSGDLKILFLRNGTLGVAAMLLLLVG